MADEWKAKGNAALQANNLDEAIECYTKAIELDGSNHVFFSNRSAAYLKKGETQKALDDGSKCIDLNPTWAKGYSRKGAALHTMKKYDEAMGVYEAGLEKSPGDATLTSALQDVKKAKSSMQSDPMGGMGNPFAQMFGPDTLAKIAGHPKLGKYLGDADFLSKIQTLQTNPNKMGEMIGDPRIMEVMSFLMGIDIQATGAPGDNDEMNYNSNSAMDIEKPKEPTPPAPQPEPEPEPEPVELTEEEKEAKEKKDQAIAAKVRGNGHYTKKEFVEALACYDEAISLCPTDATFLNNKAAVYFEQKEYEKCIAMCEEAVEIGRANRADYTVIAKAFQRMGKSYNNLKQMDDAIASLQRAQMESYDKAIDRLLKTYQQTKKKLEAEAYIDPELAKEAKERGNVHFKAGKWADAIKEYEEAVKRDPSVAAYHNNLAAALAKLMEFPSAKAACEKALSIDPNYVKAWCKKGDIEFFMKEYHRAMESYQKGLSLDQTDRACMDGLRKVSMKINSASSEQEQQERAAHGLADPEIQRILQDPMVQNVLRDMQENPMEGQKALQNPGMREKISKLVAAGVLKVG